MHRINSLASFRGATFLAVARIVLLSTILISGSARPQSWVLAEGNFWYWPNGEATWSPDEATLADAMQMSEAAFHRAAEAASPRPVPSWSAYTLEYQGRIAGNSRVIRIGGDCDIASRTVTRQDGLKERVIVTGGGGTCLFRATYDATTKEVIEFQFSAPY